MSRPKEAAEVTSRDRKRYARARARGETLRKDLSAVVSARYEKTRDCVELMFGSGGFMAIPRTMIPGLESASKSRLEAIKVSLTGGALSWRSLDVDVYLPGLVQRAFGCRLFAAATGHRAWRRSKAKAAAAKVHGAKGATT